MANGQTFIADMKRWQVDTKHKADMLARQTVQEIARNVVLDTPVLTGFLRGNWQPSLGQPAAPAATATADADGARTLQEIIFTVAGMSAGERFYLVNNAKYGMRIEFGFVGVDSLGRHYNQPGQHFVSHALLEWQDVVDSVAESLKFKRNTP